MWKMNNMVIYGVDKQQKVRIVTKFSKTDVFTTVIYSDYGINLVGSISLKPI